MKASTEIVGLPIIAGDGRRLGVVADLLFDQSCTHAVGVVLRSGYVFRQLQVVGFDEIQSIGPTSVIVADGRHHRQHPDKVGPGIRDQRSLRGRPVVSGEGRYLGALSDVFIDEERGDVLGYEVAEPKREGMRLKRRGLPAELTTLVGAEPMVIVKTDK